MVASYYKLTVYNNSMHFYELFQTQIEIFWINTLLTFDECFQQCSGNGRKLNGNFNENRQYNLYFKYL